MATPKEIQPIQNAAPFVAGVASKVNEIAKALKPLMNITGTGAVQILTSDSGILITVKPGGSLPPGYTFEEFTICDSGEPATRWWPTWTTNPEA